MKIEVCMDHVVVEGTTVPRPPHMARSEWIRQWEAVEKKQFIKKCSCGSYIIEVTYD